MKTNLLRMTRRAHVPGFRSFPGLGQMQPVHIAFSRFSGLTFSCEGVSRNQACVMRYPLPAQGDAARAALADLIAHKLAGTKTACVKVWERDTLAGHYGEERQKAMQAECAA